MLDKLLINWKKILVIVLVILAFAVIRYFENKIFYDPFITHFKRNFDSATFPEVNQALLGFNYLLRYLVNSFLSLLILRVLINDKNFLKFATFVYLIFFFITIGIFFIILNFIDHPMLLFYVRRFIIQPLLLLLFVAGYFYQKMNVKKITSL